MKRHRVIPWESAVPFVVPINLEISYIFVYNVTGILIYAYFEVAE